MLQTAGISTSMITIVVIVYNVLKSVCGHRLRSECCGREMTTGVSVEQITPRTPRNSGTTVVEKHIVVEVPESKPTIV